MNPEPAAKVGARRVRPGWLLAASFAFLPLTASAQAQAPAPSPGPAEPAAGATPAPSASPRPAAARPPAAPAATPAGAPRLWKRSATLDGVNTSQIETMALQETNSRRFVAAIPLLEELAARLEGSTQPASQEKYGTVLLLLGEAFTATGSLDRAIATYDAHLAAFPNSKHVDALNRRLVQLLMLNDAFAQAAATVLKILSTSRNLPAPEQWSLRKVRAEALIRAQNWAEAAAALEDLLASPASRGEASRFRSLLIVAYAQLGALDKIQATIPTLTGQLATTGGDFDLAVNLAAAADKLRATGQPIASLALFKLALENLGNAADGEKELATLQERKEAMVQARATPADIVAAQLRIEQIKRGRDRAAANPNLGSDIRARIATLYGTLGAPYEELEVLSGVSADEPTTLNAEQMLYRAFFLAQNLGLYRRALALSNLYLERHPEANAASDVIVGRVQLLLHMRENQLAIIFIEQVLGAQSAAGRDQLLLMLGLAQFNSNQIEAAEKTFQTVRRGDPNGPFVGDASYWTAMTFLFRNRYEEAQAAFSAYVASFGAKNPGQAQDAAFRAAVCLYALSRFGEAETAFLDWLQTYPTGLRRADVYNFLGDLSAQKGDGKLALRYYRRAEQTPGAELSTITYSFQRMADTYEVILREWAPIEELYTRYLREHGTRGDFSTAILRVGQARQQQGKLPEMLAGYDEAIRKHGNEGSAIQMDDIIDLYFKSAATDEVPFPWDRWTALRDHAEKENLPHLGHRLLRVAYAAQAAGATPPQPLPPAPRFVSEQDLRTASPAVLAWSAEVAGERDPAYQSRIHQFLIEHFGDTRYAAAAAFAAGRSAFAREDYLTAESFFKRFRREYVSDEHAAEALRDLGKCQLARGDTAQAIETFEQVLANRDWRGEIWAECLVLCGEARWQAGEYADAHAYFQRVYVLYAGYPQWMARAYLRAAETAEKLGLFEQAEQTLREMLSVRGLEQTPDYAAARDLLARFEN